MSVVSVEIQAEGWEGSKNRLYQRTYTLVYRVTTNSRHDGPVVVTAAVDPGTGVRIPRIGETYFLAGTERDDFSFVESIDPRFESRAPEVGGLAWLVTVKWSPYDAATFSQSPVNWPIQISVDGQKYERPVYFDQAGNPIKNSAFGPFAEPVTIDNSRAILQVQRNEACKGFNFLLAEAYTDTVNLYAWNGFNPRTVKCSKIAARGPVFDSVDGIYYYQVDYIFEVNRDTWDRKLRDQGFTFLDGSTPPKPQAITVKGQPVSEPVFLDGSGHVLASTGTPVALTFQLYPALDFAAFNLDFSKGLGA